ncbi:potassium channel family protein [Streptacidiphilus rugosus]|uniref:potassium channel family protein n=1 Tax=Streptacidiphilus rugosus TaxID=405783 RepID=UPI00068ABD60|nr:ion channel [Streptacidiphilus rugosus]
MDDSTGAAPQRRVGARLSPRQIVWIGLRVAGSITVLMTAYYLLPLDRTSEALAVTTLVLGLVAFTALVTFQVFQILKSPFPGATAAEALAISVPFFLLLFAATYVVLAAISPISFGVHLSHTDALYFSVTVLSTVGFGDITAKSETARLVVTGQMITDLVVLGVAIKVIVGAARRGGRLQAQPADGPPEPGR